MNLNRTLRKGAYLALAVFGTAALAKPLGTHGPTFPIGELDMLRWIEARLTHFERTGKLADMQEEMKARVTHAANHPAPVDIGPTTSPKRFWVNPSVTLPIDIKDPSTGRLFGKKGDTINPFDRDTWPQFVKDTLPEMHYTKALLFFDARDPRQLAFAKAFTHRKPMKYILTGGPLNETASDIGARMYFDQQGTLTRKLHLQHVPALAEQDGTRWRVQEFDVSTLPLDDAPSSPTKKDSP
ncbi:conjugal transfer pilus assembly protein TraW [Vibrio zhanjiangensis]|uniref:Conjugal transfer pilus assembly protein TraW n=1 Tax=Vibrio zhanjiangensis TaxID=1046128 RepID=A0ABQ6F6J4_9VIBR|nr:conjugal transfer pilus assembly protein TraW [Vibrio zhanjiangensis]